jgi:hypothetical protein
MSAERYPLHLHKGEDFSLSLTIEIDGVLYDLSGASVYAQIRQRAERGAKIILDFLVEVDGVPVTNPATTDNEIVMSLTDAQTAAVDEGEGWYDLLVVDPAGIDTYYLEGKVTFHGSVTVKP